MDGDETREIIPRGEQEGEKRAMGMEECMMGGVRSGGWREWWLGTEEEEARRGHIRRGSHLRGEETPQELARKCLARMCPF